MPRRPTKNLERWEVALVKAMLAKNFIPQDIQAYFSRPTRSINHARFSAIRDETIHKGVKAASEDELAAFLSAWPNHDPGTGLNLRGDELLIKAREAMIAAVHTFNGGGLFFRAELFIVTTIIAWTYLLHAYYRRKGVDYRHFRRAGEVARTPSGAEKYWELSQCIAHGECPLGQGVKNNLRFLIEIRNEIEHRSTSRIDDALSAKLQACCINFNDALTTLFGRQYALERHLPLALQFVTFDGDQRKALIGAELPPNVATAMETFHATLTDEEQTDPRFRYRVAFVPMVAGKPSKADLAIEFVKPGTPEADEVERVLLKEVERPKFRPKQIVTKVCAAGFPEFTMHDHTLLAAQMDARKPARGLGVRIAGDWYWYEGWTEAILEQLRSGWKKPTRA